MYTFIFNHVHFWYLLLVEGLFLLRISMNDLFPEFALPCSVFCPSVLLSHLKHVFLCVILFHLSMVIHNPHGQIILPWRGKIRVHIRHFGLQKLEVTNFLAKLIEKKLRHSEDILHCLQHNIKEILRISIVKVTTAVFFLH